MWCRYLAGTTPPDQVDRRVRTVVATSCSASRLAHNNPLLGDEPTNSTTGSELLAEPLDEIDQTCMM